MTKNEVGMSEPKAATTGEKKNASTKPSPEPANKRDAVILRMTRVITNHLTEMMIVMWESAPSVS